MAGNCGRDCAPRKVSSARKQVLPKMPREQTGNSIEQAGEYQNPGSLKVEIPAPAVLVRQDVPVAGRHQGPRGRNRQSEQRCSQIVAGLAPIEPRVRDHDFSSGDEQGKKTKSDDPVSEPDECRVSRSSTKRRGWDGQRSTWDIGAQRHMRGF